ncbi:monovalent cation/H+ antiporter complex subunit F [Sorangium sp. So ce1036]|uniref:monovalent cation/H+ antiporter complex subunit F n=1 Tax=Sorangium sp. So ce1036 TaxID=3133328 RepID=UPI003F03A9B1
MLYTVMQIVLVILAISLLITFVRLWRGPTLPDRIVAMDLVAVLTVGIIVATTAGTGQRGLLDAASLIALVGFMGTVAYTWYVLKAGSR